jgi:MscS family membrane protein
MTFPFLNNLFTDIGIAETTWQGSIKIFSVVLLTFFASFVALWLLRILKRRFARTDNPWDDALLLAARKPLTVIIWIIGLSIAASVADDVSGIKFYSFAASARHLGIILMIGWFILRFISGVESILISPTEMKKPMDQTTVSAMGKLLRGSIVITTALIVLQSLGYSIAGILAFGGIGGIAIGFAAKDLLANFFGGLMIYLDRPFNVGDSVRSPDRNIEGTVEVIGWRLTTIRTFDKRPLYVPNATFATISVENISRMSHRFISEKISIRYEDAHLMDKLVTDIRQMLLEDEKIDNNQNVIVNFTEFNTSSLNLCVSAFTEATDQIEFHQVKHNILLKIYAIISTQGATIASPTQAAPQASKLSSNIVA